MDKKIFLDSGVLISLGIIHKFCAGDVSKLSKKSEILYELQKDSINIIDKDVHNFCKLYEDIINKNIMACVPPFVYKEIAIDSTNSSSKLTTNFFYNTNCFLALPNNLEKADGFLFPLKTVIYANQLEKIDIEDSNDPSIHYGLAPDIHTYLDMPPVDVNNEDRWIASQVQALSEIGDDNISFVPGKSVLWNKGIIRDKIEKLYEEVEFVRDNLDFSIDFAKTDLNFTDEEIFVQDSKNLYMFLEENEKDYGREFVLDRKRSFSSSNENFNRDVSAMEQVFHQVNECLSGVEVVSPSSVELTKILKTSKSQMEQSNINERTM